MADRNSIASDPHRPRVVQVVTSPLTSWFLLRGQLAYLREQGYDVTVISSPGSLLDRTGEREGVRVVGIPMRRDPAPFSDAKSLCRLVGALRDLRPHICHFSTPKAGLLGSVASRIARVPIRLYTLRGLRADGLSGVSEKLMRAAERVPCRIAHQTLCVGESLRERALELQLDRAEKLTVSSPQSSNGVDCTRFHRTQETIAAAEQFRNKLGIPSAAPVIAFVGRLTPDKGMRELLEAYRTLRERHPDLRLLLIGPNEWKNDASDPSLRWLQCDPQVISTGMVEDTPPAYGVSDVIAFPSYREGFPNVPLEAAAMGIPVVAARVIGSVDAVVDGVTGTLVPPKDSASLATALDRYLSDPDLRSAQGTAARDRVVAEYQPPRVWAALETIYRSHLENHGLPTPTATISGAAPAADRKTHPIPDDVPTRSEQQKIGEAV